MTFRAPPCI